MKQSETNQKSGLNKQKVHQDTLGMLKNEELFSSLSEDNQKITIDALKEISSKEKDGGLIGRLIGANKTNASISVVLILCILLLAIVGFVKDEDIQNKVFTTFSIIVGYIFGINKDDTK